MSEEKKESMTEKESQSLDFDSAKNMTVGEAVRKDSEIKAGVTEDDSILDKYIKQHRDQVSSQKFDTKISEFETLDTETLDNFIKKQREELAKTGFSSDQNEEDKQAQTDEKFESVEEVNESEEPIVIAQTDNPDLEAPIVTPVVLTETNPNETNSDSKEVKQDKAVETFGGTSASSRVDNQKKSKKKWLIAFLLLLIIAVLGLAFALQKNNQNQSSSSSDTSSKSSTTTSSDTSNIKKAVKAFNSAYDDFFTDSKQTALKNSQFDKLSDLENLLKKTKGSSSYSKLKSKFDSLTKQITAIKAVNEKFSSDAIVDGKKVSASVKSDANFDDIKSATLNTGNASLDSLLQQVVSDGKKQLEATKSSSKAEASKASSEKAKAEQEAAAKASQEQSQAQASTGITNYDASILQRQRSRVPYNESLVADKSNSAWTFNSGVLEKIIATAQSRGYISGYNFILEPVNIINGNGYYNMYKPDGTYLFSINDKTGYFVGNAKGHSDKLDY
ncbi:hypothetical protein HMPREF9318_01325 [Streptococcus urinalis FB127-CNA-2]|uniref:Mid-cell-anchored protein Z n=1 Tax=Streptococcus urinalis 2285-97 TaxID=764291 RepID=G5KCQ3_9STRE|nr:cell division site-positioning protein MapZ family protein [Streptococcus urinalis]EHJ56789.1 hypothetical protein STRUR_0489 [Streptococcus urinalis 2285-97]EKS19803.1 hypothetical protein HMPREF9318_01325 [Streptococcus urinalis FB127-CNA-2]VEF31379.1 holliday junction-specific endonuclease [Streptococcus urinalis]